MICMLKELFPGVFLFYELANPRLSIPRYVLSDELYVLIYSLCEYAGILGLQIGHQLLILDPESPKLSKEHLARVSLREGLLGQDEE